MRAYQNNVIYDSSCDLPVYDEVDVLVAGGGPAGVAAAETAARQNKKTLLIEKNGFLGGAAVAGYSGTFCGVFLGSDTPVEDGPRQLVYGFTEKFLQEMRRRSGITKPQLYGKTYLITHDPQTWKEVAEDLLVNAGASILYHTRIFGVIKDGDVFKGVVIDTKSGLAQIKAKVVVDATGDADIIYRAGYAYTMGDHGSIQNPTMIFRLGGVDIEKFLQSWGNDTISPDTVTQAMIAAKKNGAWNLPRTKVWVFDTPRPNELLMNVTLLEGFDGRALNVTDPDDHSEAEQVGRKQAREYERYFKEYIPGCENSFINDMSPEVGVRQTRSIVGVEKLTNEAVEKAKKRPDGIVKSAWPIELHKGEAPYLYWLINDYYEVPYGALVPAVGENLIVAGRNLSAEHQALASCRVTAQCFGYGHAAGIAASMAIDQNCRLRDIKGEDVRLELNKDGAQL